MIQMKSASAEIFIYGDITSDKWLDTDTTAKSFVDELKAFDGKNITVHVNSPGGDVFAALTIHNALKNYSGTVTAQVDGLAASAASLIVCGADKVVMASNALMMLHMPATILNGYYTAADLTKARDMLTAVEDAIVDTYQSRINRADSPLNAQINLRTMLESETWLNARDALKWGFADEVAEAVDMQVDNSKKVLVVNSIHVDMKKFDEVKLRRAMEAENMSNGKVSSVINNTGTYKEVTTITETPAVDAKEILKQERARIGGLMKLRGTNSAVNAIVDAAIENGDTLEKIQPYLDAVKNLVPKENSAAQQITAVIKDQMTSGAEGVAGGQEGVDPVKAQQDLIVQYANGGKNNG
ncbi:MAG: Clp protease ClpP [Selenomonadaceae bacterium]|nr:Clp protease ClpP [Selenomonadaceae bacterium]